METQFINEFSFTDSDERITISFQAVKRVFLMVGYLMKGCIDQNTFEHIDESRFHEVVACGKIDLEPDEHGLEELRHLKFKETEGECNVEYGVVTNGLQLLPLKLWKHNIDNDEKPKLASI